MAAVQVEGVVPGRSDGTDGAAASWMLHERDAVVAKCCGSCGSDASALPCVDEPAAPLLDDLDMLGVAAGRHYHVELCREGSRDGGFQTRSIGL